MQLVLEVPRGLELEGPSKLTGRFCKIAVHHLEGLGNQKYTVVDDTIQSQEENFWIYPPAWSASFERYEDRGGDSMDPWQIPLSLLLFFGPGGLLGLTCRQS